MVKGYCEEYMKTSAIKKNKIMPFVATWVELEILILSEVNQKEKDIIYSTYMGNLMYGTNEPIYRIETNSWTWRTDLCLPRGRGREWDGLEV